MEGESFLLSRLDARLTSIRLANIIELMATLTVEQKPSSRKIKVEIDRGQFERLASSLGLFDEKFLESLERAEREVAQGKIKPLRSLRDLRRP